MTPSAPPGGHEARLKQISVQFLMFGARMFGHHGEAFLGRPQTVALGAAKLRGGTPLDEVAMELVYREARTHPGVREELVASVCAELMKRDDARLGLALQGFPSAQKLPLDVFLLGNHITAFTIGPFPGTEALTDRLAMMLRHVRTHNPHPFVHSEAPLILRMVFLQTFDREILRRVLLGQSHAEIGTGMAIPHAQAKRESARILRNARRWWRKKSLQS